jgi:hypothetical protein
LANLDNYECDGQLYFCDIEMNIKEEHKKEIKKKKRKEVVIQTK